MRANPLTWAIIRILTMRGKRHLKELRHNCARADDLSRELLLKIVRDNRDTEYGRAHHFSEIKSIEDYKRLVPLSTYDDYAPYIERMRETLALACGADVSQVNVKATTEERLGFTGAGEGIAAHAVALITALEK